jgi:hypothetical protein
MPPRSVAEYLSLHGVVDLSLQLASFIRSWTQAG